MSTFPNIRLCLLIVSFLDQLFQFLCVFLDNVDAAEAKGLFEANFSHIYHILYDSFIQAETNLRQRGRNLFLNVLFFSEPVYTCYTVVYTLDVVNRMGQSFL